MSKFHTASVAGLLAMAGCGLFTGPGESEVPSPGFGASSTQMAKDLHLTTVVPAEAGAGVAIPMKLRIRNSGLETVKMRGGANNFGFIVTDRLGRIAYRDDISVGEYDAWPTIAFTIVVKPGEEVELDKEWNQRDMKGRKVAPGAYRVVGVVNAHQINGLDIPERTVATEPVDLRIR